MTVSADNRRASDEQALDGASSGTAVKAPATRDEIEFLPAALEVQNTPPPPLARAIAITLALLFVAAVLWSIFGRVDVVAVAQGNVVSSGRTKVIQPSALGVVRAIHVDEGQAVEQGDLLVTLDPTIASAEVRRLRESLMASRLERARFGRLFAHIDGRAEGGEPPDWPDADSAALRTQQRLLDAEIAEYQAKLARIERGIARRRAELDTTLASIEKLETTQPLLDERAASLQTLVGKDLAPRQEFLALEKTRLDHAHDLNIQRQEAEALRAAIAEAEQERDAITQRYRREAAENLAEAEKRVRSLEQQVAKASRRLDRQQLRAPIDGVVQQLQVHTVGGVVKPAQELMRVVPAGDDIEVRAWLPNKDVGFVREGQEVVVKIETFPFTKYGTLPGRVVTLSDDAVRKEKLGLVYAMTVALERHAVAVNGRDVPLAPGMVATAEVKTGERRLIEYILSPLLRYQDESARER